jgi:hypothetical protein
VYVLGHAGGKGALFLLAGIALNRYGSLDEITLHGRGRNARVVPGAAVLRAAARTYCRGRQPSPRWVDRCMGDRAGPGGRVPPRRVLAAETRRRCASLTA